MTSTTNQSSDATPAYRGYRLQALYTLYRIHIRTTNPIESTFATVRLRTAKTRGCVSRAGILAMVFKLTKSAEQRWRKLKGAARLAQVIDGVHFKDGLQEEAQRIAA